LEQPKAHSKEDEQRSGRNSSEFDLTTNRESPYRYQILIRQTGRFKRTGYRCRIRCSSTPMAAALHPATNPETVTPIETPVWAAGSYPVARRPPKIAPNTLMPTKVA
jgi:hypothetical protein